MTDSGADALRRAFENWAQGLRIPREHYEYARIAFMAGCGSQKRRDAAIARGEKVEVVGPGDDAYNMACEHCAEAIEAGDHT